MGNGCTGIGITVQCMTNRFSSRVNTGSGSSAAAEIAACSSGNSRPSRNAASSSGEKFAPAMTADAVTRASRREDKRGLIRAKTSGDAAPRACTAQPTVCAIRARRSCSESLSVVSISSIVSRISSDASGISNPSSFSITRAGNSATSFAAERVEFVLTSAVFSAAATRTNRHRVPRITIRLCFDCITFTPD